MKELLKQYNDLKIEIRELEVRIESLRKKKIKVEKDSVKGSNPHFPYEQKSFVVEGYDYVGADRKELRLKLLSKTLKDRLDKCEELKLQIEQFINDIPDSRTRRVFQYRYIDNMEWLPIAYRIGGYDESYPRKIHERYLEKI